MAFGIPVDPEENITVARLSPVTRTPGETDADASIAACSESRRSVVIRLQV